MEAKDSILQNWNDVVFENRNKEYGAYAIRESYSKNMLEGLLASVFLVTFLFLSAHIASLFSSKKISVAKDKGPIVLIEPPVIYAFKESIKVIKPTVKTVNKYVIPVVTSEAIDDGTVLNHAETPMPNGEGLTMEGEPSVGMSTGTAAEAAHVVQPVPIVDYAEVMPSYEGGVAAMMRFVQRNMKYPHHARVNGIEGLVYVQFVVNYEGKIVDVKVVRGISVDCDQEAARVIAMMPTWKPGLQGSMPVSVRMVLPINFKLEN